MSSLVDPRGAALRSYQAVRASPQSAFRRGALEMCTVALCALVAWHYASLQWLWLAGSIGLGFFGGASLFFAHFMPSDSSTFPSVPSAEPSEEWIDARVARSQRAAVVEGLALIAWLYSWSAPLTGLAEQWFGAG